MPKHHIYRSFDDAAEDRIELHWQRGGGVQVASTHWAGDGDPDRSAEYLTPEKFAWAGQFVTLSRADINHLIKQLRAARDQAFGRDQ